MDEPMYPLRVKDVELGYEPVVDMVIDAREYWVDPEWLLAAVLERDALKAALRWGEMPMERDDLGRVVDASLDAIGDLAKEMRRKADEAYLRGQITAYERAASIIANHPHTCMSDKHCDFLHAAQEGAAEKLRAMAAEIRARAALEGT